MSKGWFVYKYAVPLGDEVRVMMPAGANILTVQMQNGEPYVWAKIHTVEPLVERVFQWCGTGHPADDVQLYVGTVQMAGGRLVFHLFVDFD